MRSYPIRKKRERRGGRACTLYRMPEAMAIDGCCVYCGSTDNLTLDHILPHSRGGNSEAGNLMVACAECNNKRGDRFPYPKGKFGRFASGCCDENGVLAVEGLTREELYRSLLREGFNLPECLFPVPPLAVMTGTIGDILLAQARLRGRKDKTK